MRLQADEFPTFFFRMDAKRKIVVGIGELLWDILPSGQQLGGAPANFAYISSILGDEACVASRVGADEAGREALELLRASKINADFVQIDERRATGSVTVEVDANSQPTYSIVENVAWDELNFSASWQELARRANIVCFGSLAQRTPHARMTIQNFLRATPSDALRIFDVNLRPPFYSTEIIVASCKLATIVKLNNAELLLLIGMLGLDDDKNNSELTSVQRLLDLFNLNLVCLTRGDCGSLLVTPDNYYEHAGVPVRVVDTVGAGDAFTATLAHFYARGATLERISDAANRVGAYVVANPGAMPKIDADFLDRLLNG